MTSTPTNYHNPIAVKGFSAEGAGSDFYDVNRPSYPKASLQEIYESLTKGKEGKKLKIVELGSGTGIFTRLLIQPPKDYPQLPIESLVAVEPSEGMRDSFTRNLPSTSIEVSCLEGTFSEFPAQVEEGTTDAILIAQAFHWADPDYESPIQTITKALASDGSLVLIWNLEDEDASPCIRALREAYQQHESGSPQYRLRLWEALFQTPTYLANFEPPSHHVHRYTTPCTISTAVNRAMSKSYTSVLPPAEKEALTKKLEGILEDAVKNGSLVVDAKTGVFEYPYGTEVVICKRK